MNDASNYYLFIFTDPYDENSLISSWFYQIFIFFTFHILYTYALCKNVIKMQEYYKVPDEGARKVALGSLPGLPYKVKKALEEVLPLSKPMVKPKPG